MKKNWLRFLIIILLPLSLSCKGNNNLHLKVTRLKLKNGLTCLLVKRDGAPVFSAYVRIKVGNIEEVPGSWGLAHFFEHMAFKGTSLIGTKDYDKEKVLLDQLYAIGEEIVSKRRQGVSEQELQPLKDKLSELQNEEEEYIEPNEFVRIYQRNGGADINATTSNDYTSYFVSLPSNKLELWAYLESERLKHPVLREFYKERDVVAEERRMRYDNSPDGKLYEAFMVHSFDTSPYRMNVLGSHEDIQNLTYDVAKSFRDRFYIPSRIVMALVGNFDEDEAKKVIEKYFGDIPAKVDDAPPIPLDQPNGDYPREATLTGKDEPRFYVGFKRPPYPSPDDEIFDVIQGLLCDGRTSRLFSTLVEEKKMATSVDCYASLPGNRLDGLFAFYAVPLKPYTNQDIQKEILSQIDQMKTELVKPEELKKVQNQIIADNIWELKSNMGLANMLTFFESLTGSWKYLYNMQDKILKITPEDIQRVMKTYFIPQKQVTVYLEKNKS